MTVLYGSSVADTTLTTACKMATATGGTEVSKTSTNTSVAGNFCEVSSQGIATTTQSSIPATPSGNGWVYSPGAGTFANAIWSAKVTLSSGNASGSLTIRFFKKSSGTYTSIGTIAVTMTSTAKTVYSFANTTMPAVTFTATDVLYIDLWYQDTTGASGDHPVVYESSSATAGVANDMQVTTSTFTPASSGNTIVGRARARYLESIASTGQERAGFLLSKAQKAPARNTFKLSIRSNQASSAKFTVSMAVKGRSLSLFVESIRESGRGRSRFFSAAVSSGQARSRFLEAIPQKSSARSRLLLSIGQKATSRATYLLSKASKGLARAKFTESAALLGRARSRFYSAAVSKAQARVRFTEALTQKASTRARFLLSIGHRAASRAKYLISKASKGLARAKFAEAIAQRGQARSRFSLSSVIKGATGSIFKIAVSGGHAITVYVRSRYKVSIRQSQAQRSKYLIRFFQTGTARSLFKVAVRTSAQAHSWFLVRFGIVGRARSRYLLALRQSTQARSRFLLRLVQAAYARTKFLVQGILVTRPIRSIVQSTTQALSTAWKTQPALGLSSLHLPALSTVWKALSALSLSSSQASVLTIVRQGTLMPAPNSTIFSTTTVTDTSGALVSNASAVSLVVHYPDNTSTSLSLGAGITNLGGGQYQAKYNTKQEGEIREVWSIVGADGTTLASAQFLVGVEY